MSDLVSNRASRLQAEYEEYKAAGRIWGQVAQDRIRAIRFDRISKPVVEAFLALPDLTTTISDILDSLGLHGAVSASRISPMLPGSRLVGTATTLRNIPERKSVTRAAADSDASGLSTRDIYYLGEPGDVLVVDAGGNPDISNMGGQSITGAKTAGFAGIVADGAVRDLPTIRSLEFPVWARGATPITGKHRLETVELNGPVTIHDIIVHPGDLVLADDNGLCFVPSEHVADVLQRASAIASKEKTIRDQTAQAPAAAALKALIQGGS